MTVRLRLLAFVVLHLVCLLVSVCVSLCVLWPSLSSVSPFSLCVFCVPVFPVSGPLCDCSLFLFVYVCIMCVCVSVVLSVKSRVQTSDHPGKHVLMQPAGFTSSADTTPSPWGIVTDGRAWLLVQVEEDPVVQTWPQGQALLELTCLEAGWEFSPGGIKGHFGKGPERILVTTSGV